VSQIDIYATPGPTTWSQPTSHQWSRVIAIGGGAGGGSGAQNAAGNVAGAGGGGAGGAFTSVNVGAGQCRGVESVYVGRGGLGASLASGTGTSGANGEGGVSSLFGTHVRAIGGTRGKCGNDCGKRWCGSDSKWRVVKWRRGRRVTYRIGQWR
jgi:hypothetical protein